MPFRSEPTLESLCHPDAYARGLAYQRAGAVRATRRLAATQFSGDVQGSAGRPYTSVVRLDRDPDGSLVDFTGACTCPVKQDCKHCVALAIEVLSAAPATSPHLKLPAAWERSLRGLLADEDEFVEAAVGLQFELADIAASRYATAHRTLRIRPVLRGRNGWIRTGVSWSNLGALTYSRHLRQRTCGRLLQEILTTSGDGYYYSSATVRLESIGSRRIWDLLAEAQAAGIALVQHGKAAGPVRLSGEPATVTVDAVRDGEAVSLRPRLSVDGQSLAHQQLILVGKPVHGLAWTEHDPATGRVLWLCPLHRPIDDDLAELVFGRGISIPDSDQDRFFGTYYPILRRRLTLVSGDGSVAFPESTPPELVLQIAPHDHARLDLRWYWDYRCGEAVAAHPLWADETPRADRDPTAEAAVISVVEPVLAQVSELWEDTPLGTRVAADAVIRGIESIDFVATLIPRLAEISGLRIEALGELPVFREADNAPVIKLVPTDSTERDWFDLAVTASIDGQTIPFEQLFVALARADSHLILASGTYFALERPELARLAELITESRALQETPRDTVRLSRYQASLWEEFEELDLFAEQATQWQASIASLAGVTELKPVAPPLSLQAVLRPYQQDGLNWLAFLFDHGLGGVLADEMGLGKTLQALALICRAKQADVSAPFLIVAPTSVVGNWASETARFAPGLRVATVSQTALRRGCDLSEVAAGADLVVTSYTLFRLEYEQYELLEWAGLVLDEAQFVKNSLSEAYRCAKKLSAPFKLAITGTPMENNLAELWSLLSITAPGLFPNLRRFSDYYRTPIEKEQNRQRLAQLRRRVKPVMLRRSKQAVLQDLPTKQEQVLELELNPKHRRVYDRHLARERQKVLGLLGNLDRNRFEIFRSLTLLRQASLDAALIDDKYAKTPSTKLDALMELLAEIVSEGHRTLVFSQFTRFLGSARDRLDAAGIGYCYLDGRTRNRATVLTAFKEGTAPVFLISLKAGGFGLNLTEADYCILLDPWWNPATEAQAVDRVHRIGQANKVMVYRLVAKDTIEDKVMALKAAKADLFTSVLDGGDFASAALTATEIRGLLE